MKNDVSVALHYDRRLPAPLIVARGKGDLARKLNDLARAHGIPIIESAALAESLYPSGPGQLIPERFYQVTAEILGFVWRTTLEQGDEHKKVIDESH